jgi:plasmid stabilization system protein ParE
VRELTSLRPYVIRYAVLDAEVWIVTIRHSARKPLA